MEKFTRYFKYFRPVVWYLVVAIFFGIIFGASSGLMPYIVKVVLRTVFEPEDGAVYTTAQVLGIAALLPAVFVFRGLAGVISGYLMSYCSIDSLRRMKQDIFARVQSYPVAFFDRFTTGDLLVRLSGDTASVQAIFLTFSSEFFKQFFQLMGGIGALVWISYSTGKVMFLGVFILAAPFCVLPVQVIRKRLKRNSRQAQIELSSIAQLFNENLDAVHEVRVFNLQRQQISKFERMNMDYQRLNLKVVKYELMQQPFMEILASVLIAGMFVYIYKLEIGFAVFAEVGITLYLIIDPIKRIMRMASDFIKSMPLIDRINEVLDYETTVPEAASPVALGRAAGAYEFRNVNFSYKDKPVLSDASIRIPAGTSCALVGESGAGKSTFAKLAMRFYDPCSGEIRLDGIPLRDVALADLYANIGSVPQYPVLFNDTIFENIRLARPGASDAEVYEAARKAYADEFVRELENGYDTVVGERGDRLSGGQKQRIAIARVFLKDAPIIFLDEATSALDSNSEAYIQQALDTLMRGRTVFIIAHRFSTIKNADKIIVFREGRIIDFGTHAELMERCEYFRGLYERQMAKSGS